MAESILSKNQQKILRAISDDKSICEKFYLTGGTALAEFYLRHRLSEDLDFFSETEFDTKAIAVFFKRQAKKLKIEKVDFEQSFNRNLFFLHLQSDTIKTEFTYFPFPRIEKKIKISKLPVDSLIDIAVNKVFTIYQRPRARDFIDLYFIMRRQGWKIENLVKKAKIKFDWHIDYLQLGSQFAAVKELKDYPRMIVKTNNQEWQNFFIKLAKSFGKKILK